MPYLLTRRAARWLEQSHVVASVEIAFFSRLRISRFEQVGAVLLCNTGFSCITSVTKSKGEGDKKLEDEFHAEDVRNVNE